MATNNTQSTVTLIINGEQSKTTLKEVTQAVNATTAALRNMREADNPAAYQERIAELGRLREAQAQMRNEIMSSGEAQKGFFSDFKKGFSEIEEIAGRVTAGAIIYKGVSAALDGIGAIWGESEKAFIEAEKTQTQLQAVLKSTSGAAGETQQALLKLQEVEMNKTGVDDDVIAKGEEMLLTFTNVKGVIYEKAIPAIVDMTAAMNGGDVSMESIQKTSLQVGKALNDPINGLTALKKVGVSFTEQQKDQIKVMQDGGNMMGAQTVILNELAKEFGGTAEALKNTSSGLKQTYETDLGNLEERIGAWIVNMKNMWLGLFDPLIKALSDTRTEGEKLTEEFNQQAEKVNNLQKNTLPLISRYEELTSKGKLNRDEQGELKKIIAEVADVIPGAVTQWDKYGNALGINTKKAKEFYDVQKALMEFQNKDAISSRVKDRDVLTAQRNALLRGLNSGQTTEFIAGGTAGTGTSITRDLKPEEIKTMRDELRSLTMQTKTIDDAIKGLTGSFMDDLNKKTTETTGAIKALSEMTVGELEKRIQSLNESLKDTKIGSAAYKKIIQDIRDTEELLNQTKKDKTLVDPEKEKKAQDEYLANSKALNDKLREFDHAELADTLSKNDKEVAALENKYNKEWTEATAQLTKLRQSKNSNEDEIQKQQDAIDALAGKKSQAVADLRVRQDQAMVNAIIAFRDKMAGKLDTELQKETDLINAFYNDQADKYDDNDIAKQDAIEAARQTALNNAKGSEATRLAKQLADTKAKGITPGSKEDFDTKQEDINKKYDAEEAALKDKFSSEIQATQQFQDVIAEMEKQRAAEKLKIEKEVNKAILGAAIQSAQEITAAVFDLGKQNRQAETDAKIKTLETQKAAELDNANLTQAQKDAINQKYAKQEAEIKLQQWEADKEAAIEMAIINGAVAITKALTSAPWPLNLISAAGTAIATGVEVAKISDQKPPQFSKGGTIQGLSHAAGGIPLVNGNTGQPVAEVEGDETVAVFSKEATRNNQMLIRELLFNSQYRNGAPVKINTTLATMPASGYYANGGIIPNFNNSTNTANKNIGNISANSAELAETNRLLAGLHNKFDEWGKKPWDFNMRQFRIVSDRMDQIDNNSKG
ncbi:hypothetical protein [Mucilaginibacter sp.]|uniref:hypothetical protein n=1 Tax=Mucilaginibacter sp. TaxID=1882438 RepID=UPI0026282C9C|nr:hypothetical protein [Mucilaginibacter sp.]MDB4922809.1 phage tail tape measure protein family [Mucilaginibacter sp.]